MILFRAPVRKFGLSGVKPVDFAALGDFPSPLADDPNLGDSPDDEYLWCLLPPLIDSTSGGTTTVNDQGGYAHDGAADGTYVQGYRILVMPPAGATTVEDSDITITVGELAALCLVDGVRQHKTPAPGDRRLYLTASGAWAAKTTAASGDRLLRLAAGGAYEAGAPA